MIYIHKQNGFWNRETVLQPSFKIGSTLDDHENGAYLLLNAEQELFYNDHPSANQLEVWRMELTLTPQPEPVPEQTALEVARQAKLAEIEAQDKFSEKFFVMTTQGGVEIANVTLWANSALRTSLISSTLPAVASDGKTTTTLWSTTTPSQPLEVPIDWAKKNLLTLEIYAKRTYDLMQINKNATLAATTVDEVQAIDVKANYPHILTFELNLDLGV
ncbi:MAG: hypothetical protein LUH63_07200 [Parabacteroides sp.]|nr:hypothetical protein [Parabacteroides sp.]